MLSQSVIARNEGTRASTNKALRIFGPMWKKATMRGKKFIQKDISYFVGVLFTKQNNFLYCLHQLYKRR